jgi:hypothetical protein
MTARVGAGFEVACERPQGRRLAAPPPPRGAEKTLGAARRFFLLSLRGALATTRGEDQGRFSADDPQVRQAPGASTAQAAVWC